MSSEDKSSAATNCKDPSHRKKKKKPLPSISSLPDELLLNCLARVSRLYPNWVEVFDLNTQTWGSLVYSTGVMSLGVRALYPKASYLKGSSTCMSWAARECHCVIDDVLYFWDREVFKWYDFKENLGKKLNGIEELPDLSKNAYCKMVDLGGKMGFLWSKDLDTETNEECRIWGNVEWFDSVLRAHKSRSSFHVVSASVSILYTGKLKDSGKVFESNLEDAPLRFRLGGEEVIKGLSNGVEGMRAGDKRRLIIPPSLGRSFSSFDSQRLGKQNGNSSSRGRSRLVSKVFREKRCDGTGRGDSIWVMSDEKPVEERIQRANGSSWGKRDDRTTNGSVFH
ncbi:hypothetical protein Bca101_065566 [Brassica carinata]